MNNCTTVLKGLYDFNIKTVCMYSKLKKSANSKLEY